MQKSLGSPDKNSLNRKANPLESVRKTDLTRKKYKTVEDADLILSSMNNKKKKENSQKTEFINEKNKDGDSPRTNVKHIESVKQSNKAVELKKTQVQDDSLKKKERKSRSLQRNQKTCEKKEVKCEKNGEYDETMRRHARQQSNNKSPNKIHTRPSSKNDTNSRNEDYKIIPKMKGPVSSKDTAIKDSNARSAIRSKKNEYVINYDDKNGTVSSVTKIRSNSGSPKRKPVKDTARDKLRENLKNKASDKVALRK